MAYLQLAARPFKTVVDDDVHGADRLAGGDSRWLAAHEQRTLPRVIFMR